MIEVAILRAGPAMATKSSEPRLDGRRVACPGHRRVHWTWLTQ